jgi:hypothetical protein
VTTTPTLPADIIPPPVGDDLDRGTPAAVAVLASAALLALVIVTLWVLWGVVVP